MFTAKMPLSAIQSFDSDSLARHTITNGGFNDTDANALTVTPRNLPSCTVVTTVTPLANRPRIFRSV